MIKSCKIRNFKSLQRCELKNIKRITLLGGKNNTGKTALMEALFLHFDRLNPECFIRLNAWRGVQYMKISSSELFAPFFYNYDRTKKIEIEVSNIGNVIEEMAIETIADLNSKISFDNININKMDVSNRTFTSEILKMRVKFTGGNNRKQEIVTHTIEGNNLNVHVDNGRPNDITKAVFLVAKQIAGDNGNAIRYGELVKENEEEQILNFLRYIEPRLKSLTTVQLQDNMTMLYGDIGMNKKIPINYMGDGIARILSILLAIISNKDGVVFIDEIENGIHHSVMQDVWEMVNMASKKYNCQVIATTHSYECLSSLILGTKSSKEDIAYIRLERNEDKILSKEYEYDMLSVATEQGWEVR